MIVLRLERVGSGRLDLALARLDSATLVRAGGALLLAVDRADRDRAVRGLAYAGVRATELATSLAPPAGLVAAAGRSLAPVTAPSVHDTVAIRPVALGTACAGLVARRFLVRGPGAARRARCRSLLRGDDAAFLWVRRAWAAPAVLRAGPTRAALRPIVFDRVDPAVLPAPDRLAYAADGALGRWAFP